jgi:molecular chaperone Hsp33
MKLPEKPIKQQNSFTTSDFVQPFMIDHSAIRGRLVRLEKALDTILTSHDYPLCVSLLLAEQVVLAAMLSATLAGDGILTVQTKGYGGAVNYMVVDVLANGVIRGYARIFEERADELLDEPMPLAKVLGRGALAVTLDPGEGAERYQGIVSLDGATLSEAFRGYFVQSQQAEVVLHVAVHPPAGRQKKWAGGGIIIERMPAEGGKEIEATPEEQNELWERTKMFMGTLSDKEMLNPDVTPQNLLYRLFNEDGVWVYKLQPLKAGCRCSRHRMKAALKTIALEELLSALDNGKMIMHCEFCNKRRAFTEEDLRFLHAPAKPRSKIVAKTKQ